MTKISLNSDNSSYIYNLVSNAKTKLNEAANSCRAAVQACPSSSSYGRSMNEFVVRIDESKKSIGRVGGWFELLKTRNDKTNEDSEARLDRIEDVTIKRHDLYVK